MVRWYAPLLAAVIAFAALVPARSAGKRTPTALYRVLLAATIPASKLPPGLSPPAGAQRAAASADSKAHHAVGVVQIFLNGGTDDGVPYIAGAYYDVFPNRNDALAAFRAEPGAGRSDRPASFPTPARIVNTSLPNGGIRYLGVEFVDQNVRVFAYVANTGENPLPRTALTRALSLGRFALRHLEQVRSTS